ncbi:unnamed protein product [Dracunculus medinensis]|uniref:U3 small nucleolar RNA-associated protein 25 n=1 Tax=Dracunculus medinensis TaxID=318479 RepID=A0A0N4U2F2_DRAME|nr:unnamed protein product [Dracunculus medinensis]
MIKRKRKLENDPANGNKTERLDYFSEHFSKIIDPICKERISNSANTFMPSIATINLQVLYCLHSLHHIISTRNLVISNNLYLRELREKGNLKEESIENARDQGFARPKVLILCPMRKDALSLVNLFRTLIFGNSDRPFISNFHRFQKEFGGSDCGISEKRNVDIEFKQLMSGNIDDCFRIGIGFAKKCLKLYTSFADSDIIIASPLGLRMVIADAQSEITIEKDFLASIEILIIDKAEILLMQNWEHVLFVTDNLHCQPKEITTDISRVRHWSISQDAKLYRQTVLLSSFSLAEFKAFFKCKCFNFAGLVSLFSSSNGYLDQVETMVYQELQRIAVDLSVNQSDIRFQHFKDKVLRKCETGTAIFIPSYFDFVRIRNFLKNENESFVQLCEYSKPGKIAKARDLFFKRERKLVLITERFHFFKRYHIKGIKSVIFYQPPAFPKFYHEIINMAISDGNYIISRMLYTKFDAIRIINIFGKRYYREIAKSVKDVHILLSE